MLGAEPAVEHTRRNGNATIRHDVSAGASAEGVQLVFVEAHASASQALQIRIESIAPGTDASAAITQRRPDLLLIAAGKFAAADCHVPLESKQTLPQSAGRPDCISAAARGSALKAKLAALRGLDPQLPLIVTVPAETQGGELVIDALRAGATDVVSAATPADRLREKILLAAERRRLQKRPTIRIAAPAAVRTAVEPTKTAAVIGSSDGMLDVLCRMARFAAQRVPVLVHGEPGTGKSLLALTLHRHVQGSDERTFIIDCGQFAPDMLDRLLFDSAEGGVQFRSEFGGRTLIVENVDLACARVQRRLLAAVRRHAPTLQQSPSLHFAPSHSPGDPPRLVLTCSRPVNPACQLGFAADSGDGAAALIDELRFELTGYTIELPPLRTRGSDVTQLIDHFIRTLTGTAPVDETVGEHRITEPAKSLLERYDWPGNVTQLRSVLAAELQLSEGTIVLSERLLKLTASRLGAPTVLPAAKDLPIATTAPPAPNEPVAELNSSRAWSLAVERYLASGSASDEPASLYGETIQEVEAGLITAVLEKMHGNLAQSARLLGITRVSLRRKIHGLGLQIPGRSAVQ